MTNTPRDKWLLVILPAFFTAGIYVWAYGRPAARALDEFKSRLTEQTGPNLSTLTAKQRALEELSDKLAEEKDRATRLMHGPQLLATGPDARSQALLSLSSILTSKGLTLVKSAPIDDTALKAASPDVERLSKKQHLPAPQFWRVEMTGTYQQMWETLQSLSRLPDFIVPINIEMNAHEKAPDVSEDPQKNWSLILWI